MQTQLRSGLLCLAVLFVTLIAFGCKGQVSLMAGSRKIDPSLVVGTWNEKSLTLNANRDGTFSGSVGSKDVTGTWKVDSTDIVFTPEMIGDKTVSEWQAARN